MPVGVGVSVDSRLLGPGGLGGGPLAGSGLKCNRRFTNEVSASGTPTPQSTPAVEPTTSPADRGAVICESPTGSVTDVASEPDWRPYGEYRAWTTADGCLVRIDVLADRPGPDHCGWQSARVIIATIPIGKRYSNEGNAPAMCEILTTSSVIRPPRQDGGSAIYLVAGTTVERWPLDPRPAVCM